MPLKSRDIGTIAAVRFGLAVIVALGAGCSERAPAGEAIGAAAAASDVPAISGPATVIDGDSMEVDGVSIRLFGVDTFESAQYCHRPNATRWRCGHWATVELDRLAGGRPVACSPLDKDSYGRVVARCRLGSTDLARHMVASGWGLAYRKYAPDYIADEDAARKAGRGAWGSEFEAPWDYRRRIRGN